MVAENRRKDFELRSQQCMSISIINSQIEVFVYVPPMEKCVRPTLCPFRVRTHQVLLRTQACVRNCTWLVCQHNPHKAEHLHSHLTGGTIKQSNFNINAVEHAHSIVDCLRLQKIGRTININTNLNVL